MFSDIYYAAGWKAYVDEKETPIVKANYVLRAIRIPAGAHHIVFKFHPDNFYKAKNVSLVASFLLILVCIAAFLPFGKKLDTMEPIDNDLIDK